MASISSNPKKHRVIQFMGLDGRRKTVRLGKCSLDDARQFGALVEELVAAARFKRLPAARAAEALGLLDDGLHAKLAAHGLCAPKTCAPARTLAQVIAEFQEKRQDAKESTRAVWKQAFDSFTASAGGGADFAAIAAGHADDWRQGLVGRKLRDATIRKRTRVLSMLFAWAARRGYRDPSSNPVSHLPMGAVDGREKPYVPAEHALAVIDELPSAPWKVLLALSRFAGLRVPSEALALRWHMVNWEKDQITVPVPKLAHIAGKETRVIPIFAELRPWLLAALEEAPKGETRVVYLKETTCAWLRKMVRAAIERAAVPVWSSTFHAMRASCETDLMARFPAHVVAGWIGHDLRIAQRHYAKILDRDFQAAAAGSAGSAPGITPASSALQKALQTPGVTQRQPATVHAAGSAESPSIAGKNASNDAKTKKPRSLSGALQWATQDSNL